MLKELHIKNYAIIDSIAIRFSPNLNIITGETGAGKSILMGALSLILGDRADTTVLMDKESKCVIEGVFMRQGKEVKSFLKKNDLDEEEDVLIRREINPKGKSRAFINDSPVTLAQLKELASLLVDLHQQFDTLELNNNDFQREVLDALADNGPLLESYKNQYHSYKKAVAELDALRQMQATANKELDYNQFLWNELHEAAFKENEIEETEDRLRRMSHAEDIKTSLAEMYSLLEEGDEPVVPHLQQVQQKLATLSSILPEAGELASRTKSVLIELQDISSEIESLNNKVVFDAEELEILNDRMTLGYTLLKKHHVQTTSQLQDILQSLESELEKVTNLSDEIAKMEEQASQWYTAACELAAQLSDRRKKVISSFEEKTNKLLVQVGMVNARVRISVTDTQMLNEWGRNTIEFLFNANKSERFEPVRKVASGGELSRLMLIIKSLVAQKMQLPTLIFDEIDSGISGEAARQVGEIIRSLSHNHQLISITHQPQIAARGDLHFEVYKEMVAGEVSTQIRTLSEDERVVAIATMLSGRKPTEAAFENARELMRNGKGSV